MKEKLIPLIGLGALGALVLGVEQCPFEPTPEPTTHYYMTCGDPVCRGYTGPFEGVPLCTDQELGDPCADDGALCDPKDECNALVICSETDPSQGPCPISARRFKEDIRYLDVSALKALHQQVMDVPLATWRYKREGDVGRTRLGFIIEDLPQGSLAVEAPKDMVDVYGWTSMAVASMKVQQAEIDALQKEVAALRAEIEASKKP